MNDITTEQLGTSEWLTDFDVRKLEEMYKCKSKPKQGMNFPIDLVSLHDMIRNQGHCKMIIQNDLIVKMYGVFF